MTKETYYSLSAWGREVVLVKSRFQSTNLICIFLAYVEIRLILANLLYNFDIEICEESENWIDQDVYTIWNKPALMVHLRERSE
ncbi:hypothetical protein N7490_009849 [Penicillium lividum]|nr:hypothetical protein N7490_009849 [Penicillium lividum]